MSAFIDATDYGIIPANTPAMNHARYQRAINDAQASSKFLFGAPGQIKISEPLMVRAGLKIEGAGIIAGSTWNTAIESVGDFPAIMVRTNDPVTFRDFSALQPPGANSAAIDVDGVDGNTNYYTVIERLRVSAGIGIHMRKTSNFTLHTILAWGCKTHAVRISQAGDSDIDNLISNGVDRSKPAVYCDGTGNWGGLRIVNSKLIGGGLGFHGIWGVYHDGVFQLCNTSIEGMAQTAAMIERGGNHTGKFGTVLFGNNVDFQSEGRGIHIPTDPAYDPAKGPWLNDVTIIGTPIFAPVAGIDIDGVGSGKILGNKIRGSEWGIIVSRKCRDWEVDTSGVDGKFDLSGSNIKRYAMEQVTA